MVPSSTGAVTRPWKLRRSEATLDRLNVQLWDLRKISDRILSNRRRDNPAYLQIRKNFNVYFKHFPKQCLKIWDMDYGTIPQPPTAKSLPLPSTTLMLNPCFASGL